MFTFMTTFIALVIVLVLDVYTFPSIVYSVRALGHMSIYLDPLFFLIWSKDPFFWSWKSLWNAATASSILKTVIHVLLRIALVHVRLTSLVSQLRIGFTLVLFIISFSNEEYKYFICDIKQIGHCPSRGLQSTLAVQTQIQTQNILLILQVPQQVPLVQNAFQNVLEGSGPESGSGFQLLKFSNVTWAPRWERMELTLESTFMPNFFEFCLWTSEIKLCPMFLL